MLEKFLVTYCPLCLLLPLHSAACPSGQTAGQCCPCCSRPRTRAEVCTLAGYESHCPDAFHIACDPATPQVHFVFKGLEGEVSTWCFIGASGFFSTFSDSLHVFVLGFCTKIHANTHFRVCEVVCKHCWTVFLCNVCLGCPKTGSLLPECSDVFPGCFLPSGAFPLPLSLLSSSMAPGVRESGPEAVEPANCRQNDFACSMWLERGPWACRSDGGQCS